jgi:hypothetical protein
LGGAQDDPGARRQQRFAPGQGLPDIAVDRRSVRQDLGHGLHAMAVTPGEKGPPEVAIRVLAQLGQLVARDQVAGSAGPGSRSSSPGRTRRTVGPSGLAVIGTGRRRPR